MDLGPAVRRALEALREAGRPLRVGEIANLLGSHENTVRSHLGQLVERGLVTTNTAPAAGRGRPAVLYAAGPRPGTRTQEYRALVGAFAADLVAQAGRDEAGARARRIGRGWGERLSAPTSAAGVEELESTLAELGFGPERGAPGWRLTTCPLLDLAEENPEVICQVHLGLVEGIVGHGADDHPPELTPFAEPGACRLTWQPSHGRARGSASA